MFSTYQQGQISVRSCDEVQSLIRFCKVPEGFKRFLDVFSPRPICLWISRATIYSFLFSSDQLEESWTGLGMCHPDWLMHRSCGWFRRRMCRPMLSHEVGTTIKLILYSKRTFWLVNHFCRSSETRDIHQWRSWPYLEGINSKQNR